MRLISRSPDETERVGFRIGRLLAAGDVVKVYGDLGAGKTTMIKGIARAFGIERDKVISPSFTIITEYEASPRFVHVDLYRIEGGIDLASTGFRDCFDDHSVVVVEWPEHGGDELPEDAVVVRITNTGLEEREIVIEGIDEEAWHNL